jgi:hypothetical protein
MDLLGLAAVAVICVECMALGALSGATAGGWPTRLLIGVFLIALAELVLALLGVGFSTGLVVLIASGALALVVGAAHGRPAAKVTRGSSDGITHLEQVGWGLLGLVLLGAVARSVIVPEAGWDAYSHWGLKAQAYTLAGSIVHTHTVHEEYPPLVPLLEAWLYQHRGSVSIDLSKTIWAVVGTAFGLALALHLRSFLARAWLAPYFAIGIVLATTQLLEDFWTGQADLALTVFLTMSTLAALQWLRAPSRAWLVQAVVFAAAAALTKYEGLPRVAVVAVAVAVEGVFLARRHEPFANRVFLMAGLLVLAAVAAFGVWVLFEVTHGIPPTSTEHLASPRPDALAIVLATLTSVLSGARTGGGVLVVVLAAAVAGPAVLRTPMRFLTLVVLGQAVATLIAFLVADTPPDVEVRTAATRLIEQFLPVALFASAVWLAELGTYNRRWR